MAKSNDRLVSDGSKIPRAKSIHTIAKKSKQDSAPSTDIQSRNVHQQSALNTANGGHMVQRHASVPVKDSSSQRYIIYTFAFISINYNVIILLLL